MVMQSAPFSYADLFAGIGGFHAMLNHAGGRCVYVSEIDGQARETYLRNWVEPLPESQRPVINTDITLATPDHGPVDVPPHDVLAAWFPCQPFSKSGYRSGMDEARQPVFGDIARILEERAPAVVVLENVQNIAGARHTHEWDMIIQTLREIGYRVSSTPSVFSPHLLPPSLGGTPQARDRVFILGTYVGRERALNETDVPPTVVRAPVDGWNVHDWNAEWILDDDSSIAELSKYQLTIDETNWVDVWDDLVQRMWSSRGVRLPGFPLWADAWVPEQGLDPFELEEMPRWKSQFLIMNARFYDEHQNVILDWKRAHPVFATFPESRRKLEWHAQDAASLWETVMHFRPSGIRAKAPTYLPALVPITQTSIIGRRRRRLTPHEAARLQGFSRTFSFTGQRDSASFRQVGNSVAVGAAWHAFRTHVERDASDLPHRLVRAVLSAPLNPTGDALAKAAMLHEAKSAKVTQLGPTEAKSGVGLASSGRSRPPAIHRTQLADTSPPRSWSYVGRARAAQADPMFFLPAATVAEAVTRIFSLTGAADAGTRGEKRAIVALRDALELDIDVARTNARMAQQIAEVLRVEWRPSYEELNRVSLDGLNALLEGATAAYHENSLRRLSGQRPGRLAGPEWLKFQPAQSKIEAVNRISALTNSGPEWLGPGSKEHKRVLINLANSLAPELDTRLSKTKLGAALAHAFGAPWSAECKSTGETISLVGLNTLLAGAERRLGKLGSDRAMLLGTPEEEGKALAAALLDAWRASPHPDGSKRVVWDARKCIHWMVDQGVTEGPNQNEWQGFYWESRGRAVLNAAFTPNPSPPRTRYGNTAFDYSLQYVWDLKAHTEAWRYPVSGRTLTGQAVAPLNDQESMSACIEDQGLGFLMAGGVAVADEDETFVEWHRHFKAAQGVKSKPSNSGRSRQRKAAFEPLHVEAFYFHNLPALEAAKAAGQVTGFQQGKQAPDEDGAEGRARRPKYNLSVPKARRSLLAVARFDWPE